MSSVCIGVHYYECPRFAGVNLDHLLSNSVFVLNLRLRVGVELADFHVLDVLVKSFQTWVRMYSL